ncbi:uncharacterized protein LOC128132888 [Lactuca sativa]|uniref:uncharacterized protein LOC128132888 n=1 Tax=Lactuca sativa TaxID=4236 RepID=UPI0022B05B05|nr:uncharacterized protein LOC128132888 [Lactuca sativa]
MPPRKLTRRNPAPPPPPHPPVIDTVALNAAVAAAVATTMAQYHSSDASRGGTLVESVPVETPDRWLLSQQKGISEEEEESDLSECELTSEEYAIMVTNPKKFARRKFPMFAFFLSKSEKVKDEAKISSQKDEDGKESKLTGDSRYDCNYCHGKNRFAKDCMLRKEMENADDDVFGGVEVWSTDSEDEEVRNPTHGKDYVAKEEGSAGKCLIFLASPSTESASEEPNMTETNVFQQSQMNLDTTSEFDEESEMSEISVEDVLDYSEFVKSETENEKPLISENSVEFVHMSKDKPQKLKEKAMVYQKSAPIDNADETEGLSEQTSWRVKGRYVVEPINKPSSFDKPSTSGTKEILEEPKKEPKAINKNNRNSKREAKGQLQYT